MRGTFFLPHILAGPSTVLFSSALISLIPFKQMENNSNLKDVHFFQSIVFRIALLGNSGSWLRLPCSGMVLKYHPDLFARSLSLGGYSEVPSVFLY
jgi:hypothetical protein